MELWYFTQWTIPDVLADKTKISDPQNWFWQKKIPAILSSFNWDQIKSIILQMFLIIALILISC